MAAPIPDAPPVTSAVLPSSRTGRSLYSAAVPRSPTDPVAVIGASGALGFGLALRLGRSRRADRDRLARRRPRAQETAERRAAEAPDGSFAGYDNAEAAAAARDGRSSACRSATSPRR